MISVKKTENGSYKYKQFQVFLWVGFWRWGSFNIGDTRVFKIGPVRVFIKDYNKPKGSKK